MKLELGNQEVAVIEIASSGLVRVVDPGGRVLAEVEVDQGVPRLRHIEEFKLPEGPLDAPLPGGPSRGTPYREPELLSHAGAIETASRMARRDAVGVRDQGTCVLGAGIAVDVVGHGKRKATRRVIIHAPFQGNVASYKACQRACNYLREKGLDCYWYDGVMD